MSETIDLQDPTAVHEAVVADRLQSLRDEFWVLRVDPPNIEGHHTGVRIAPAHACICPNCSEKKDTLLYGCGRDIEDALFCDSCFDDAHRAEIEAQLSKENERDYS